jgi:hypothetical protein
MQQYVNVRGNGNIIDGAVLMQVQKFSVSCDQDSKAMTDFQNNMTAAIKQAASDQDQALLNAFGHSDSEVDQTIHNDVQNVINLKNIQEIVNTTNQQQGIDIHGNNNIVRNITMDQSLEMLATNSQKVLEQMSTVNSITQQLDQQSSTVVKNPISGIIDSIGNAIASIWDAFTGPLKWFFIVLIVVAVAYLFSGAFGSKESPPHPAFDGIVTKMASNPKIQETANRLLEKHLGTVQQKLQVK